MKEYFISVLSFVIVLAVLFSTGCEPKTPPYTGPVTMALVNGLLIDGTGAVPLTDAVVLIAGERILAVGRRGTLQVPRGVKTIDLGGAAILPGFINAHVHFAFNENNLLAWARGGVTTVRDESVVAGNRSLTDLMALRDRVRNNPGEARLVSAGTMITVPGGYGELFVSSPEEARRAVLREISQGVDGIKVSLEDGYAGRHDLPKLTPVELKTIVDTAHGHGLFVSGHITQGKYIRPLIDAGVDDIAHLPYDSFPPETISLMVKKGIYLTPTFTVLGNYGAPVATCVGNLRRFVKAGGMVALGNDYGGGPGVFELGIPMYEIRMMAQADMSAMQIIIASTRNAAHVLKLENELGTLEPGKTADILVVKENPLENLQALTDIGMVIHGGVIIRDELHK
jgi:imidazolonepropionase-like amidohydrolase